MATTDRYDTALSLFIERFARNSIHTNIRGKVVGVDYSGPSVDVQPMASTEFPSGATDSYPVIYDVPVNFPSGANGKALLSMPIAVGDIVGLAFSERNEGDNTDVNTHQLFPGWAVTQIFTDGNRQDVDPTNVVLKNDKAVMVLMPDGTLTFNNGSTSITAEPGGRVLVNGAQITAAGDVITKRGISLDDFYDKYVAHVHGGVENGGGNTSGPSPA